MMGHMHTFGCRAYVIDQNIPRLHKMRPRAFLGILVGYNSTNIFQVWVPLKNKVIETRDVRFDDSKLYDPEDPEMLGIQVTSAPRLIEVLNIPEVEFSPSIDIQEYYNMADTGDTGEATENADGPIDNIDNDSNFQLQIDKLPNTPNSDSPPMPTSSPTISNRQTPAVLISNVSRDNSPGNGRGAEEERRGRDAPRGPRTEGILENNILEGRTRRQKRAAFTTLLQKTLDLGDYYSAFAIAAKTSATKIHISTLPSEPTTWKQLKAHPKRSEFERGCLQEFSELKGKGTYRVKDHLSLQAVSLDEQANGMRGDRSSIAHSTKELGNTLDTTTHKRQQRLMWVFKYKCDTNGYITKYKSRLMARGDLQVTEEDTYAVIVAVQTFRAIMAIATTFDLKCRSYDVKNAYINTELMTPVYCKLPPGQEQPGKVLVLLRALYGLKNSPNLWYRNFTRTLKGRLGLCPVPDMHCCYTNKWLTLIFYVDDIVTIYHRSHQREFDTFKQELLLAYDITTLGPTTNFLGIQVIREREERKTWLLLDGFIEKMANRFKIPVDVRPPQTPLPTNFNYRPSKAQASLGNI